MMQERVRQVLQHLEALGRENDARETERAKRLLNLEPDTALLISMLVRSSRRTRLLEIGTSNGYSTIWLADAVRETGGHLTSIELLPEKRAMAQANLESAGLTSFVTLLEGDATGLIATLSGPYDLVFLDADRRAYVEQFQRLHPLLAPDALILTDNVHSHPDEIADYIELMDASPEFDHVVVGVGKGLSIAYRNNSPKYFGKS